MEFSADPEKGISALSFSQYEKQLSEYERLLAVGFFSRIFAIASNAILTVVGLVFSECRMRTRVVNSNL